MQANESILIVGAERGLGLGLVEQFLDRGWRVHGTARQGEDTGDLMTLGGRYAGRLGISQVDVTRPQEFDDLVAALDQHPFDVIFMNAGIWGPMHQSVMACTDDELLQLMKTNTLGPIRLAKKLLEESRLCRGGTLAFMNSHRGSIALNVEGGLELYRMSKACLNMLARGVHAEAKARSEPLTVLSVHPGWAATRMGTLDGTVDAEISVEESVRGVADVVLRHRGCGEHLYLDYKDQPLPW